MKTYFKSIGCCALGLSLSALSPALWADDKDPAALQAEIDALEAKKDALQEEKYPRAESTKAQIQRLEDEIDALEVKRDEAEMSREEKAENKEELYKGNANHSRDMIKAESKALQERIGKASDAIDKSEKTCTEAGYATLRDTESFTYEQKVAHVDKFKKEAALTLASLDQAAQDMIYTYHDARRAPVPDADKGRAKAVVPDKEKDAQAKADSSVNESEEDTYEGNANHARDLIKEEADAIRERLDQTVGEIKKAEDEDIEAVYAAMREDGKFPYKAKYECLNTFKEHAADALMSLHNDACDMLPAYKEEARMEVSLVDKTQKDKTDSSEE